MSKLGSRSVVQKAFGKKAVVGGVGGGVIGIVEKEDL